MLAAITGERITEERNGRNARIGGTEGGSPRYGQSISGGFFHTNVMSRRRDDWSAGDIAKT